MTQSRPNPSNFVRRLNREKMLLILDTAAETGSQRFLRQAALLWLSSFPGDLEVNLLLARALVTEGKPQQARPILEKLCRLDPEFSGSQQLLDVLPGPSEALSSSAGYWLQALRESRDALAGSRLDEAEQIVNQVLAEHPDSVLAAVLHVQLASARSENQVVMELAQLYRTRWPDCLQFALLLAEAQLNLGDESAAVILLHHCVVNDAAAQVPVHIWGEDFPYRPLWPEEMEISFDLPVPAEVAARLGWNLLPAASETVSVEDLFTIVQPEPVAEDENVIHAAHGRVELPGDGAVIFPFIASLLRREEEQPPAQEEALAEPAPAAVTGPVYDAAAGASWSVLSEEPLTPDESAQPAEESTGPVADPAASTVPEMCAGQGSVSSAPVVETPAPAASQPPAARLAKSYAHSSETLASVEEALERVARHIKKPGLGKADGRYPVYVIFTTRTGLTNQYGTNTLSVLEKEMARLVDLVRRRPGWGAMVFCPDDPESMASLGLTAVTGTDPWKLKLSLADLDKALAKKGQMIGALLILGGPNVVPFHHLPNPTDDHDTDVPSDNPYATLDSNYFVQDWPVGRLPGETGNDAGLLLEQLRQVIRYHAKSAGGNGKGAGDFWQRLQDFLNNRADRKSTFGYTAAVWKRSSLAVYRQIGDAHSLVASPPKASGTFSSGRRASTTLAYYNLHGVADGAEWYGQRDLNDSTPGPDYPVAIAPKDISGKGSMPEVVFSEACYGAHITGKNEEQSMALKFLSQGTLALVGSTVTAYGSVTVPLIGADLLGNFFWKRLKNGSPVGEALQQARVDLVREMNKRQGFLDGEDQKTLISFVLYGDPLVTAAPALPQPKGLIRQRVHPDVRTICDRNSENSAAPLSNELLSKVKAMVAEYLPGIDSAELRVHLPHGSCDGHNHTCPTSQMPTAKTASDPEQTVVTVAKSLQVGPIVHHQYARVTLDSRGKLIKLAVSR